MGVLTVGATVVCAGVVLMLLPGPGIFTVIMGLPSWRPSSWGRSAL
ncbi:PGPGW domain-containing protein [Actinocorallia herbida]